LGERDSMIPDVAELCAVGEAAFANDEFEEAEAWYELACAGRYIDPRPGRLPRHDHLIANRFARWEQLRTMMYQRSVRRLGRPVGRHGLAVMTCMKRNEGCASTALLTALQSWRGPSYLHVDGLEGPMLGQARSFFKLLEWAADQQLPALTLLEDDIVLAKNALDYIATTRIDYDLGFISWFSVYRHDGPRIPPLLHCIEARDYQFNQAITFPARTVHELLASDALKNWSEPHGADRIYKDVFPDRKVAIHYPNLVQHVGGTQSLVGNDAHGPRESMTFIGVGADAFDLLAR
jgi:hypothetical protein